MMAKKTELLFYIGSEEEDNLVAKTWGKPPETGARFTLDDGRKLEVVKVVDGYQVYCKELED